eukprot:NODE_1977_length_1021_cov_110.881988.p1 GENE.NODE_1977_length_1021_cov_110.881988~~NODE_1977_length_1021_cov_110.881988.p1  ORF type:complete len:290 (-),score=64.46 NODE_1977_length_1021_cov_110.881988:125-994(-)
MYSAHGGSSIRGSSLCRPRGLSQASPRCGCAMRALARLSAPLLALGALVVAAAAQEAFPACVEEGIVYRHEGRHGVFADVSHFGTMGCWNEDCTYSDKFRSHSMGLCARACAAVDGCGFWSYGTQPQDGGWMCYLRKGGTARQELLEFYSGTSACGPPPLRPATVALLTSELGLLRDCMYGGSSVCPRPRRAVRTWKFAIEYMGLATAGQVEAGMRGSIEQIASDTAEFAIRLDEDFPAILENNHRVAAALKSFLTETSRVEGGVDLSDDSLPLPMRGLLCGDQSCYQD